MANTIKTTIKTEWFIGSTLSRFTPNTVYSVETTSDLRNENTQLVGTTHELIALGDVTDDAFCMVENLHATALVQLGREIAAAFVGVIDIPAGGPPAILPLVSTLAETYLVSNVASTPVRITLIKVAA
jgi:hypothetical protein